MVKGPPTTPTARAPMPTSAASVWSSRTQPVRARIWAKAMPVSAPASSEAKNSPPRKPDPSETAEASILMASSRTTVCTACTDVRSNCSAPCPADSACGESSARRPTIRPPSIGRATPGMNRLNSRSKVETARIQRMARPAQIIPSAVNSR